MVVLIKGKDLTPTEVKSLPFKGKVNPEWVKNHSFYFNEDGTPAKGKYPVCHSLSHLPY